MFSPEEPGEHAPRPLSDVRDKARILDDLGDKMLDALALSVTRARADFQQYQATLPEFVIQASARGRANWIHDRLWHHISTLLDDTDDVFLIDLGATREIVLGDRYRIRMKSHKPPSRVASYPTQAALAFMQQAPEQLVLDGLEQIRLIGGYEWMDETSVIGPAVLSMRDGQDNVLWVHELSEPGTTTAVTPLPPRDDPEATKVRARIRRLRQDDPRSQEQ